MREALSDEFDVETLLHTDEQLSFRRPGLGPDVCASCAKGTGASSARSTCTACAPTKRARPWALHARIARSWACAACAWCTARAWARPGRTPVLKARVLRWLVQKNEVLAFVQARPAEGGAGALVVLLKPVGRRGMTGATR